MYSMSQSYHLGRYGIFSTHRYINIYMYCILPKYVL
jgi:hypothetical protein